MSDEKFASGAEVMRMLDEYRRGRIGPMTSMQCKVCWYVYDPREGCPEWNIPEGTPFLELPEEFSCPRCGNPPSAFIPLDEDA